jgi:hypothetical protein
MNIQVIVFRIVTTAVGATLPKKRITPSTLRTESECSFLLSDSKINILYCGAVHSIRSSDGGRKNFIKTLYVKLIKKNPIAITRWDANYGHKSSNQELNNSR